MMERESHSPDEPEVEDDGWFPKPSPMLKRLEFLIGVFEGRIGRIDRWGREQVRPYTTRMEAAWTSGGHRVRQIITTGEARERPSLWSYDPELNQFRGWVFWSGYDGPEEWVGEFDGDIFVTLPKLRKSPAGSWDALIDVSPCREEYAPETDGGYTWTVYSHELQPDRWEKAKYICFKRINQGGP